MTARGNAEIMSFDAAGPKRELVRYLGTNEERWPQDIANSIQTPDSSG